MGFELVLATMEHYGPFADPIRVTVVTMCRIIESVSLHLRRSGVKSGLTCDFAFHFLPFLVAFYFLSAQPVSCQLPEIPAPAEASPSDRTVVIADSPPTTNTIVPTRATRRKQPAESEIAVMIMIPDGDYRMFSTTDRCTAWTVGVEYEHSWGHLLYSRMDYVAEVLPFVLLSQPAVSDFWGNAKSPNQQAVPGVSLSPFGFRFLWRGGKAIEPFVVGKIGVAVFTTKAFSQSASYANFNVQAAFGLQYKLTQRLDLRIEPFQFFHVSNGYLAPSNPGMDQLATRFGLTYHLRRHLEEKRDVTHFSRRSPEVSPTLQAHEPLS